MFLKKLDFQFPPDMKEYTRIIFSVVLLSIGIPQVYSQSRTQLEDERNSIIEQIEQTSKNLEKTASNKKSTLSDLKAIDNQIKSRKKLIKNIQSQLKSADNTIATNTLKIDSLNGNLLQMDDQYRQLIRNMYIRKLTSNKWAYIFSSSTINDAFLRWRYQKQYETYAKQKTEHVTDTKFNIHNNNNSILEEKKYVEQLLVEEKKNYSSLEKDQKKKDTILSDLKKEESNLKEKLKKKKSQREKLNKEIEKVIVAELSKSKNNINTYSANISKKQLSWPAEGYVSGVFGNQAHPTIKNLRINNNGIDITCKKSAPVSAVANGKVISVTTIPGYANMVIVQHGEYYSVYSKLEHIIVKKNESVQQGQTLGRLKNINAPELHFEFWKGKKKIDPAKWLK